MDLAISRMKRPTDIDPGTKIQLKMMEFLMKITLKE